MSESESKRLTFVAAIKAYCAFDGETLQHLAAELKKLGAVDRVWFIREFAAIGVTTSAPAVIADAGVIG